MSDSWQGPGWWKAQDGKWYPPELHPTGSPLHGKPPSGRTTLVTVLAAIGLISLVLLGGCVASAVLLARTGGDVFEELEQLDLEEFDEFDDRFGPDATSDRVILVDLVACGEGDAPFSLRASGEARHNDDLFVATEQETEVVDVEFTVEFYDASGSRMGTAPVVVEGLRRGDTAPWVGIADGEFDDQMSCNVTDVRWVN